MGLFYDKQETDTHLVLTVKPVSYLAVLVLAAVTILAGALGFDQLNFWLGAAVLIAAIGYTVETWPIIKANHAGTTKTRGEGMFSRTDPTEYRIKQ